MPKGKEDDIKEPTEKSLAEQIDNPDEAALEGKKVVAEGLLSEHITEPSTVEPKEKTYSQKDLDEIKDKQWAAYNKTLSRQGKEIAQLKAKAEHRATNPNKTMLEVMEEQFGTDPRIVGLKEQLAREEQVTWQREQTSQAREKLDQKITDAGFDPDDEMFDAVNLEFRISSQDGDFSYPEKKLDRILAKAKKPTKETETEVAEGDEDKEEEIARRYLEKKGYLTTETGGPSASSGSFQEIEKGYIAGKISRDKYEEALKREGKL